MVMVVPMVTYELSEQELNWSSNFFFPFFFQSHKLVTFYSIIGA